MLNIKKIYELEKTDIGLFGSKAVNLSGLYKKGFNVPGGFCISKEFHEYMIDDDTLEMTADIIDELREAFESFKGSRVAVRSSSISEDLSDRSFAGLYDTYLNIDSFDDFIKAIKDCIRSTQNERVREYIKGFGLEVSKPLMAIIVQQMVDADSAGVVFTSNPINNSYDEMLINSNWGLGENVVDGYMNPDEWAVEKLTHKIKYSKISNDQASLNKAQIDSLLKTALQIEKQYEKPQDIEWAFNGDDLFILQSRDITTLYPVDEAIDNERLRLYLCYNTIIQGVNEPFTALGCDFWRATFSGYTSIYFNFKRKIRNPSWIRSINGRLYYDVTELVGKKSYIKKLPRSLDQKDPAGGKLMEDILGSYRNDFIKQGGKFKLSFGIVKWGLSLLKYGRISKKDPYKGVDEAKKIGSEYFEALKSRISAAESFEDKIMLIEEVCEELLTVAFSQVMYCSYGLKAVEKQDKWLKKSYGDMFNLDLIKKAVSNNPTTEMGLELSRLALQYKTQGNIPSRGDGLLDEFMKTYGHRGTIEVDFGTKRWKDDPDYVIGLIKEYMKSNTADDNLKRFEHQNNLAINEINKIYDRVLIDKSLRKARKIKSDYINFRTTSGIRELPKFDMLKCMDLLRDMILEMGEELSRKDLINEKEDINHLTFDQILNPYAANLKEIVSESLARYKEQLKYDKIPRFILSTGQCFYQSAIEEAGQDTISGTPISSGIVEGVVIVMNTPDISKIKDGDILVTHNTNPAWTPLFLRVNALVMENGGPISHGAIVAREYGIPAVAGIPNATEILKDGDRIRVNGETGTVTLLS